MLFVCVLSMSNVLAITCSTDCSLKSNTAKVVRSGSLSADREVSLTSSSGGCLANYLLKFWSRIMILRIWIRHCIFLVLVELLFVWTTISHQFTNFCEFPFSFLLDLFGNLRIVEISNSAQFPFSFSLDLVGNLQTNEHSWRQTQQVERSILKTFYQDDYGKRINVCRPWDTLWIVTQILIIVLRIRTGWIIEYNSCITETESEYTTVLKHIE